MMNWLADWLGVFSALVIAAYLLLVFVMWRQVEAKIAEPARAALMQMPQLLEHFAAMLAARFSKGVFTTEDSIRYTFYAAASLHGAIRHTDVILEYPHPVIADAEIDTVISGTPERDSMAIEFKV